MSKFVFAYHGGSHYSNASEYDRIMHAWQQWLQAMGPAVVDGGNPVGLSSTVRADGTIMHSGGLNPISGYSLIEADSIDEALELARACPILLNGGSIEVAKAMQMTPLQLSAMQM